MTITLYDFPMAPSPRRARILLAEKQIAHDTVIVDLAAAEQLGPAYRAINPACTVPALRLDDGNVLTDNAGIAAWAEAFRPDPPLFGRTPLERATVASWQAKCEGDGLFAIAEAMRNTAPAMKDRALPGPTSYPQIPALAERGLARLHAFFNALDARLAGVPFIGGDAFSIADITGVVVVDFARVVKLRPAESHPNIGAWRARMAERASVAL